MQSFNAACIGKTLPVLIEKRGRNAGQMIGRSPYLQSVHADLDESQLGKLVLLKITKTMTNSLTGEYLGDSA
jgi:tRNA-2-methylthio-N6-dimethylallyladenosine synthase